MDDAEPEQCERTAGPDVDRRDFRMLILALAQHHQHAGPEEDHEEAPHRAFEEQPLPKPGDPVGIPLCRKGAPLGAADRAHDEDVHREDTAHGDAADHVQEVDPLVGRKRGDRLVRHEGHGECEAWLRRTPPESKPRHLKTPACKNSAAEETSPSRSSSSTKTSITRAGFSSPT